MNPRRILVAEDDASTRECFAELLHSWGFESAVTADGQETLDLLGSFHPQILLLDLKMPRRSGLEVLKQIRAEGLQLATIVISGEADISSVVQAIKLGADDFMPKPIDPARLRLALNSLAGHR